MPSAADPVVLHTREHLAAVIPLDDTLLLDTLRFADEIRPSKDLELPAAKASRVVAKELEIAERLVSDMSEHFEPKRYEDSYREDLMARIEKRVKSGETHELTPPSKERPADGAQVIDLMAALKRSLEQKDSKPARAKRGMRKKRVRAGSEPN